MRPGQGGPIAPKGMDEFPRPCAPATRFLAISMSVVLRFAHGVSLPRRRGGGLRLETTGAAEAELWLPPCRLSCLLGASPSEDGGRRVDTSELLIARAGPGRLSGREVQGYLMVEGQRAGTKRFVPAEGAWRRSSPPVWRSTVDRLWVSVRVDDAGDVPRARRGKQVTGMTVKSACGVGLVLCLSGVVSWLDATVSTSSLTSGCFAFDAENG